MTVGTGVLDVPKLPQAIIAQRTVEDAGPYISKLYHIFSPMQVFLVTERNIRYNGENPSPLGRVAEQSEVG